MARTIAIANQKGGVGKTTVAFNLGHVLAARDRRVLLVDLDPQQSLAHYLHISPPSPGLAEVLAGEASASDIVLDVGGIHFMGGTGLALAERRLQDPGAGGETALRRALRSMSRRYDVVLIDSPPSLGVLAVAGLVAGDVVLVPMLVEFLALAQLGAFIERVRLVREAELNPKLKISWLVPNAYDERLLHHREVIEVMRQEAENIGAKLTAPIAKSIRVVESAVAGKPVTEYDSDSKAAEAFRALGQEVDE